MNSHLSTSSIAVGQENGTNLFTAEVAGKTVIPYCQHVHTKAVLALWVILSDDVVSGHRAAQMGQLAFGNGR